MGNWTGFPFIVSNLRFLGGPRSARPRRRGAAPSRCAETMPVVLFDERERGVPDDLVAWAGGVAGVAQVEEVGTQGAAACGDEQTADRDAAAGRLGIEAARLEGRDRRAGGAVEAAGGGGVVVVAEIGADDDQRFRAAPAFV